MRRHIILGLGVVAGCGRAHFDELRDSATSPIAACWPEPINISGTAGASYMPTIASDGQAIYAAWTDATGYIHDFTIGTENLMFRRIEADGSLVDAAREIPKADLGTNRNTFPSMLAHDGALALSFSAQAGTEINSDGQARFIRLGLDGTPLGPATVISDDIAAPSPGVTAYGLTHELAYVPSLDTFLVSVYGKWPWGFIGAWNRSHYFVDPTAGTRVGQHMCFNNCPSTRSGHATGTGRAIYQPSPADYLVVLQPDNQPYGSMNWNITMRAIDRNDVEPVSATNLDVITIPNPNTQWPNADMLWSESSQRFVALWTHLVTGTNHEVRLATVDSSLVISNPTTLGQVDTMVPTSRMVQLADGRIVVIVSTTTTLYRAILDASGGLVSPLMPIANGQYDNNALLALGDKLLIASDNPDGEIYLQCIEP